jgi:hypothetical protein
MTHTEPTEQDHLFSEPWPEVEAQEFAGSPCPRLTWQS